MKAVGWVAIMMAVTGLAVAIAQEPEGTAFEAATYGALRTEALHLRIEALQHRRRALTERQARLQAEARILTLERERWQLDQREVQAAADAHFGCPYDLGALACQEEP